jgi:putative ABC transport system substrate-binding protein
MRRRTFIMGLGSAAAWPMVARAQQATVPVVGFLSFQSANDELKNVNVPFLQGLKETGYLEGQNVAVEYRYAENQLDRLRVLAADLVHRRVAVIVTSSTPVAVAAKVATTTIPIVIATADDPVALGLVASLNRPGANVTGIVNLGAELAPKRLQLLRELIPNVAFFGVLVDPAYPATPSTIAELQVGARSLGCNSSFLMPEPTAISKQPSPGFRKTVSVRSWSAGVPSTVGARNNSRHWQPAMRYPQSSHFVSTPWPAA